MSAACATGALLQPPGWSAAASAEEHGSSSGSNSPKKSSSSSSSKAHGFPGFGLLQKVRQHHKNNSSSSSSERADGNSSSNPGRASRRSSSGVNAVFEVMVKVGLQLELLQRLSRGEAVASSSATAAGSLTFALYRWLVSVSMEEGGGRGGGGGGLGGAAAWLANAAVAAASNLGGGGGGGGGSSMQPHQQQQQRWSRPLGVACVKLAVAETERGRVQLLPSPGCCALTPAISPLNCSYTTVNSSGSSSGQMTEAVASDGPFGQTYQAALDNRGCSLLAAQGFTVGGSFVLQPPPPAAAPPARAGGGGGATAVLTAAGGEGVGIVGGGNGAFSQLQQQQQIGVPIRAVRVLPSSSRVFKEVADCEAAAAEAATLATADMARVYPGTSLPPHHCPIQSRGGPSPLEVAVAQHNQAVLRAVAVAWKALLLHLATATAAGGGQGLGPECYSLMLPDLKGAVAAGDEDAAYLFKQVSGWGRGRRQGSGRVKRCTKFNV